MTEAQSVEPIHTKILKVRGTPASMWDILHGMGPLQASDLYLKTGGPLRFKIAGKVKTFDSDILTPPIMEKVLSCFMDSGDRQILRERRVTDQVFATDKARYRVHFAYGHTGVYGAIRIIAQTIKPLHNLGHPEGLRNQLLELNRGLFIVCGVTDSGKTVTCTSLIEALNQTQDYAILTLEDPVEYLFQDKRSLIIQREVGVHVPDFASGLKAALRENLDVIFVGELRDNKTIEQALKAAETGHLVLTTLHAEDSISAILRIIGSFPQADQPRIRQSLASTLTGVVYQRLLPRANGGRVLAIENLWVTNAVRAVLRAGEVNKLSTYTGKVSGGLSYADSITELERMRLISREVFDGEMKRARTNSNR